MGLRYVYVSLDNLAVKAIIGWQIPEAFLFKAYVGHVVIVWSIHAITIRATLIELENFLISYKKGLKASVHDIQKLIKQKSH